MTPRPEIVARAADWMARLGEESATEAEREACLQWRQADPAHERAYRGLQALWEDFEKAAACASPATARRLLEEATAKRRRAPARAKAGAAALALLLGAAVLWQLASPGWLLADHHTRVGEWRVIELEDHSRITLNTDSAIDIRFDDSQRLVVLRQGEVLVEVARGKRPFVVQTADGTAQALGTRYLVRREAEHTDVTVAESRVRACAAQPPCAELSAGQRVRLSGGRAQNLAGIDPQRALAWTRHSLVVDDRPLAEVLAELGRYRPGRLQYDAAALADLRVSGVFPLDAPDRALDSLASSLPIMIRRYTPWLVTVRPRAPAATAP
ncbi:regulator of iron dicitrate transport [Bordetella hinzii]|uniref:FecR family protein n=1 Tax=Bordetella hinzii TaxID=103855 RepID=UPI0004179331|nr:FecR family protein [Bordetella hinzii]AKQ55009.1 fec operon regulator FecR [Bordetella hinzii]KCB26607.1 sigma factor regulatory protein, FecR/PupR family [Bordetella hinzii L60]KCB50783.1 sigma factor regulatory protein, FecR/PupR family [Bordetella hinzii 1277]SNV93191.1 regulator of iron dicitrate transport [Bordetella hinzii]